MHVEEAEEKPKRKRAPRGSRKSEGVQSDTGELRDDPRLTAKPLFGTGESQGAAKESNTDTVPNEVDAGGRPEGDGDKSSKPRRRAPQRKTPVEPIVVKSTDTVGIVDVLRAGIYPNTYLDFCEAAKALADISVSYKYSDQELLDTIAYFKCNRSAKR